MAKGGLPMKLLLVDDEPYTREGILSIIAFDKLEIDEVFSAEDGLSGLAMAKEYQPDIILTDVRMPHLDGISMSYQIREFLPCCCIIFMSGFAEKDYLKSAIKLSAINYIEKPFSPEELETTLQLAVTKCNQEKEQLHSSTQLSHTLNLSLPAIRNRIALTVLRPVHDHARAELSTYLQLVYPSFHAGGRWISFLIMLLPESEYSLDSLQTLLVDRLSLSSFNYHFIGMKNENVLVVHIGLSDPDYQDIPVSEIENTCYTLRDILVTACHFILATGQPVSSFYDLYESYQTASISLQRGFFKKKDSIIFYSKATSESAYLLDGTKLIPFEKALKSHDKAAALAWLCSLTAELSHYSSTPVSTCKSFFAQAAICLYELDHMSKIHAFPDVSSPMGIQDTIWNMSFLSDIEDYIFQKLEDYFSINDEQYTQNPIAYQIKDYIEQHYTEESLSLTVLSEHFSISESYLCVIFKKTFDITINQYIINLRMSKAKQYLLESNRKIKEISELVGYRDCNYFIRLFKKTYHITPSDFR